MGHAKLSVYLSFLLRHQPEDLALNMDKHGYVAVDELIAAINKKSCYSITREVLDNIVATDNKGRYAFSADGHKIKACQGHTIPWVEPKLIYDQLPPQYLYHGTTARAYQSIVADGGINKMQRHGVHLQPTERLAWESARRWKGEIPVVLKVNTLPMQEAFATFGKAENGVWCTDFVPVEHIAEVMYKPSPQNV